MSTDHERAAAELAKNRPVRCAVLTVSDTRTTETDRGGDTAQRLLESQGHAIIARAIVRDEATAIESAVVAWLDDDAIDAVITTGGTGISRRDTTVEVVRRLLAVELEGFGEIFRMLSHAEVGAAAMMSRAVGGLAVRERAADGSANAEAVETLLFAVPGSVNAVETAIGKLVAPQLAHLVWERRR